MKKSVLTSSQAFERGLSALLVMNLLDAVMTSLWVSEGIVTEGNPVMAAAISQGYFTFVLGKVALVGMGAALLYGLRTHHLARMSLIPLVLLYSFVMGNHVGIFVQILVDNVAAWVF